MKGEIVKENAYALVVSIVKNLEPEAALKEIGIDAPVKLKHLIEDDQKEIVKAYYYEQNMSLADIGKIYKCTRFTVKEFLKRMDLPAKPRGRYEK